VLRLLQEQEVVGTSVSPRGYRAESGRWAPLMQRTLGVSGPGNFWAKTRETLHLRRIFMRVTREAGVRTQRFCYSNSTFGVLEKTPESIEHVVPSCKGCARRFLSCTLRSGQLSCSSWRACRRQRVRWEGRDADGILLSPTGYPPRKDVFLYSVMMSFLFSLS
jgi:hypothetical protein